MLFAIFSNLKISILGKINILGKRFVEHGDSGIRLADQDVIPSHLDVETLSVTCILPMGRMKSNARTCLQM